MVILSLPVPEFPHSRDPTPETGINLHNPNLRVIVIDLLPEGCIYTTKAGEFHEFF